MTLLLSALLLQVATTVATPRLVPPPKAVTPPGPIETVTIGPVFAKPFQCSEHPEGQLAYVGDALGTDCLVIGGAVDGTSGFNGIYRTDGKRNDDWYGWQQDVLAPFDGTVSMVYLNPVENEPGTFGRPPASFIRFLRTDGVEVTYAHIQAPLVAIGDTVRAGQVVAKVGNNGTSRSPHTHVGAARGTTPLQIRWDLREMGKMPALVGD